VAKVTQWVAGSRQIPPLPRRCHRDTPVSPGYAKLRGPAGVFIVAMGLLRSRILDAQSGALSVAPSVHRLPYAVKMKSLFATLVWHAKPQPTTPVGSGLYVSPAGS
jgi:hypothetical protein